MIIVIIMTIMLVMYYFSKKSLFFVLGILSLLIGGFIYLIFRENAYITRLVSAYIPLSVIREDLAFLKNDFVSFYLPDYLWGFSLANFLHILFPLNLKSSFLCMITVYAVGITYEILQFCNVIFGIGDILDMSLYLLAGLTVNMIVWIRSFKNEEIN